MADIDLIEIQEGAEAAKNAIDDMNGSLGIAKGALDSMSSAGKSAVDQFIQLDGAAADFARSLPGATGIIKGLMNSFDKSRIDMIKEFFTDTSSKIGSFIDVSAMSEKQTIELGGAIASLVLVGSGKLSISGEMKKMSDSAGEASGQLGEMAGKLLPLIPGGEKLAKTLNSLGLDINAVFAQADAAHNLENAFLRNAAAAGDFGDVVSSLGGNMGNLTGKVLEYTNQMVDVANANNVSFDSAVRLSNMLRKIPGELDLLVRVGGETGQTMNIMSAAIKVAQGTGQDFEAVAGDINMILRKFNVSGTDAVEVVARMARAAADVKMPMDLMRDFTQKSAEQFKYLGDNSQAAINVMARFGPALRESGLGPEGIRDIVTGMVQATGQLDIAQRAFVSSQTGGPGGLAGGYDLALKMQEGRMDEVFADVEQTLKQMMGGRLVTLEEAATNQGDAAQMAKQVQMLTTGPLKIADTEAQAFKILEAFAKGGMPTMGEAAAGVGKPEDVLADTVQMGNDIQTHQLDALNVVRNEAEKQSVIAAFSLDALRKIATGRESTFGQRLLQQRARTETRAMGREVIGQVPTTSLSQELAKTAEGIKTIGKAAGDKAKGIIAGEEGPHGGGTPMAAVTPQYDQDLMAMNERPARDVNAGAAYMEAAPKEKPETPQHRGEPSTIIIKVMGKDDVEQLIKVRLDEWGNAMGYEQIAGQNGIPAQK
jgi:hypothetical protein